VPALKGRRRDEREQMLGIFDQSYTEQNKKTMLVPMSEIPERFHPLIRRLQTALKVEDVGDMILIDDDFFEDMKETDRRNREAQRKEQEVLRTKQEIQHKEQEIQHKEQEIQHKEQEIQHKEQEIQHKEQEIQHKEQEVQHKEQEVQHKEQEVQHKEQEVQHKEQEVQRKEQEVQRKEQEVQRKEETVIRILLDAGIPPQVIAQKFGMSEEDVRRIEGNAPA
jgi:DNA repair exonuclease SbcCD ATPase subunit